MKKNNFQILLIGLFLMPFLGLLFIGVPISHAQSAEVWSDPVNLSNAGSSTNPAMVVDAAGVIHVIWFDNFDGYKYTKSTDGKKWTEPIVVTFPFSPTSLGTPPDAPMLLADNDGRVYALWLEKTDGGKSTTLYYSVMSPGPDLTSGWSTRTKIADIVTDFDAVLGAQGVLHIGYVSGASSNGANPVGIFYRQLNGTSLSNPINLYSSQYFRALVPEESNVRLAVNQMNEVETIYMVWDDRPQKHILLAKSSDGGNVWDSAVQLQDVEESLGQETPFNINIGAIDNQILLLWQYGQAASQCESYSLWSTNGIENFGPLEKLDKFVGCPQSSQFISVEKDKMILSLKIFGDITFLACKSIPSFCANGLIYVFIPVLLKYLIVGISKRKDSHNLQQMYYL